MSAVIGVDFGATNIRAAPVEANGRCGAVVKHRVPRDDRSPTRIAALLTEICHESARGEAIAAVGIGLAGWLDESTGIIHNGPNLGWRDVPFGELLTEALGGPRVALTNDLRAIAWGEYLFGSGAGAETLLVIYQGSGIGSSAILGGTPHRGASGVACEIGHMRVVPRGGRACGCGQRGCLEAYVGGHNLERRVKHDIETGVETQLRDLESPTCADIENASQAGDGYARHLWSEAADFMGQTIGSLITYLNPDRLILGGGVWAGSASLRELTLSRIKLRTSPAAFAHCTIVEPKLGDSAGMMGAAALARGLGNSH